MRKGFEIWFCIIMVSLLFIIDIFADGKKLDEATREAYSEGYEEGYSDAEYDLEPEIEYARISGYAEGYEKGRKEGFDTGMNTATSDSLKGEYYRSEYGIDEESRYIEDMIQDEVFERTHRIMEENEELRELLEEYDIGYDY